MHCVHRTNEKRLWIDLVFFCFVYSNRLLYYTSYGYVLCSGWFYINLYHTVSYHFFAFRYNVSICFILNKREKKTSNYILSTAVLAIQLLSIRAPILCLLIRIYIYREFFKCNQWLVKKNAKYFGLNSR